MLLDGDAYAPLLTIRKLGHTCSWREIVAERHDNPFFPGDGHTFAPRPRMGDICQFLLAWLGCRLGGPFMGRPLEAPYLV